MEKVTCATCHTARGKRICKIQQGHQVCAPCCASQRNPECQGCRHYQNAKAYQAAKPVAVKRREFKVAVDPEIEAAADRALLALERNQLDTGLQLLRSLLNEHPENHMVMYAMGVSHAMRGELDESIRYFNRALEIYPYLTEAAFNRALAYQKSLDFKNTVLALEYLVSITDENDEFGTMARSQLNKLAELVWETEGIDLHAHLAGNELFGQGVQAMDQKNWAEALAIFARVAAARPRGHLQSFGNMGLCYAQLGRRREALEALDRALALDPEYEFALANRIEVEGMTEGEPLGGQILTADYFREYKMKNRSYLQEAFIELQRRASAAKLPTGE